MPCAKQALGAGRNTHSSKKLSQHVYIATRHFNIAGSQRTTELDNWDTLLKYTCKTKIKLLINLKWKDECATATTLSLACNSTETAITDLLHFTHIKQSQTLACTLQAYASSPIQHDKLQLNLDECGPSYLHSFE